MSSRSPLNLPTRPDIAALPALGICGYSGAGKTTLIERLIPSLVQQGLSVLAVKHDAHGLDIDRPGKDSDRFFGAGADVLAQAPGERFLREHGDQDGGLTTWVPNLCQRYDLVLIEGHKASALPKIWLLNEGEDKPPGEVSDILAVLGRGTDRRAAALAVVQARLQTQWLNTPVLGGVLIGGQSSRMGTPKHLISTGAGSWLERTVELLDPLCRQVVVLGGGSIPATLADRLHLSDVLDVQGPLAGVLAAMRWAPWASWLFLACDLPAASADALGWLLGTRRPGVWATIPAAREGLPEPLLAHYDFRSLQVLEHMAAGGDFGLRKLATHPKVVSPTVPLQLANAWRNVNTRRDLQDFVDCKHG